MDTLTLKLSPRSVRGKKVKQLRRGGLVPVHFYGRGTEPLAMQVEAGVLRRLISRAGQNIPIAVELEGRSGENICFVREVQRHPVTEDFLHVDFLRVDVSQTMRAEVPIRLEGDAPAARDLGGTLLQTLNSLDVEGLPMNIPASITVDVTGLDDFEKAIRVGDLVVSAEVEVMADPDQMVVRVLVPRIEEEEEEVEEGMEPAEGDEGEAAEGEAEAEEG